MINVIARWRATHRAKVEQRKWERRVIEDAYAAFDQRSLRRLDHLDAAHTWSPAMLDRLAKDLRIPEQRQG